MYLISKILNQRLIKVKCVRVRTPWYTGPMPMIVQISSFKYKLKARALSQINSPWLAGAGPPQWSSPSVGGGRARPVHHSSPPRQQPRHSADILDWWLGSLKQNNCIFSIQREIFCLFFQWKLDLKIQAWKFLNKT